VLYIFCNPRNLEEGNYFSQFTALDVCNNVFKNKLRPNLPHSVTDVTAVRHRTEHGVFNLK
jgi:hypothetical protein